ncbi:hypothetical protein PGT21_029298 [Puccinia graminis f. sp. tritici]|uniref:Uncharacterized protein n=1 Tax=Puccinia graminis f. sp. tritici TaxID=56615 RepID=A0A5B0NGY7_PUCGR|nr:hypothetical protein PGT21_029298 [Puccinia graminis f. sp. tritici]
MVFRTFSARFFRAPTDLLSFFFIISWQAGAYPVARDRHLQAGRGISRGQRSSLELFPLVSLEHRQISCHFFLSSQGKPGHIPWPEIVFRAFLKQLDYRTYPARSRSVAVLPRPQRTLSALSSS